jgi:hypothetical protein
LDFVLSIIGSFKKHAFEVTLADLDHSLCKLHWTLTEVQNWIGFDLARQTVIHRAGRRMAIFGSAAGC